MIGNLHLYSIFLLLFLFHNVFPFLKDDGDDLGIPENAIGRPVLPKLRVPVEEADNVCFCSYGEGICDSDKTCKKKSKAACFHAGELAYNAKTRQMEVLHRYGCATLEKGGDGSHFTCNSWRSHHHHPKTIACCYEGNLCNMNLTLQPFVNAEEGVFEEFWDNLKGVSWMLPFFAGLFVLFAVAGIIAFKCRSEQDKKEKTEMACAESEELLFDSGSGSGSKALNRRTVAQNLELIETIGRGRYGDVRKARYKGSFVAVKTFFTTDEESWRNERDIYQTTMLNHNNILQYVAADICSEDSITHMLLITDYHALGSLCDYLRREQSLSVIEALSLAYSTICGVEHLHSALQGTGSLRKPEIAHRDLKSKNIIVKRPGECCVADFGLAVRFEGGRLIPEKVNVQVGTKRYMAPEVLKKTLQMQDFSQFKMADMYSFALVLWEILRCVEWREGGMSSQQIAEVHSAGDSGIGESETATIPGRMQHMPKHSLDMNSKAKPYVPPFEGMVESDPTLDEMRQVVCDKEERPPVEKEWESDPALRRLTQLMEECWHNTPQCRHTALKMKMELGKIREKVAIEEEKRKKGEKQESGETLSSSLSQTQTVSSSAEKRRIELIV